MKKFIYLIVATLLFSAPLSIVAQQKKVVKKTVITKGNPSKNAVINFTAQGELGLFGLRGPVKECVWTTNYQTRKLAFDRKGMWVSEDGQNPWEKYGSVKRDNKGRIIQMGDGEETGELFTYNSNGLMTKHITVYMDGRDVATYSYNSNGECTKESFSYGDMSGTGKNTAVFTILSRDNQGNWTKRKTQNGNNETRVITYYEDLLPINISSTPSLRSRIDSVSYCIGMAQSQGFTDYLKGQLGVDLNCIDHFTRGLTSQQNTASMESQKKAYEAGKQIGSQMTGNMVPGINKEVFGENANQSISLNLFLSGFVCGYTEKNGLMTIEKAQDIAQTLITKIKVERALKTYAYNKTAGENFLAANAKKTGINVFPNGVQYKILKKGTGMIPKESQMVKVHYKGRTIDGQELDDSYKNNKPVEFRCNQVIKGWTEALTHMPVGSIWEIYIPQQLAYGEREQGNIKPFSALIFTIELLEIKN